MTFIMFFVILVFLKNLSFSFFFFVLFSTTFGAHNSHTIPSIVDAAVKALCWQRRVCDACCAST